MGRKPHTIEMDQLEGFEIKHNLAASYGQGSHKSLDAVIQINTDGTALVVFHVESHRVKVGQFNTLQLAVKQYNEVK
jgi:hypothetical protein